MMERYILLFLSLAFLVACVYGDRCPDAGKISPCICHRSCNECQSLITCSKLQNGDELQEVFQKSGDIPFPYSVFSDIQVPFFPASSLETKRYIRLAIVNSSLSSLFDEQPPEGSLLQEFILHNVRLQRGIQWEVFSPLHSLKSLIISNTEVKRIDDTFGALMPKQVKIVHFTNTKTSRISRQAFAPLKNIESLVISSTAVRALDRNMFPRPLRVKILDFSRNKLPTLPDGFFTDMPSLTGVHLSKNNITIFKESVFGNLPAHLQYISIRDNPIRCDCSIKWITDRSRIPFIDGKCAGPEKMAGRRIRQLKKTDFAPCE